VVTGVEDGASYNLDVTITFDDGLATLNGESFTNGDSVTAEGTYTLIVTDPVGNVTTVEFSIDKTAPTVKGVFEGGLYNEDVTIQFIEGTATLNEVAFTAGSTVSADGLYTLVVTDPAGNVTTVHFEIDKTAPVVTGVEDDAYYNTDRMITFNEGIATLNDASFTSGDSVTAEGSYMLVVTDLAGNVATVCFTIDKTAPVVTGVEDGGLYHADRVIAFNEGIATLNGSPLATGSLVSTDGTYGLIVTDAAGNVTTVFFTIDTTAPVITGISSKTKLVRGVPLTIGISDALSGVDWSTLAVTINRKDVTSSMILTADGFILPGNLIGKGDYTIVIAVCDRAGNRVEVKYVFKVK